MYANITHSLDAIKQLAICELDKRQQMLVDLLVSIVNHETMDGEITAASGNVALAAQDYWASLSAVLKDAGFERLGNGHFSAAYRHSLLPGKVIKCGFKKEDSGAAYAAFCRMHQGAPGIPTIHDIKRHASCYTVVMDELFPLGKAKDLEGRDEAVFSLLTNAVEMNKSAWDEWYDWHVNDGELLSQITERDHKIIETGRKINEFFHGIASFDMHTGNVMFDRDGNMVIIDPVSFSHDCDAITSIVDPEELLKEIELKVALETIERCKSRKAKRDPGSTFRIDARNIRKGRKRSRMVAARREKQREADLAAFRRYLIPKAPTMDLQWRIPQGFPLAIDDEMQGRLMG